MSNQNLSKKAAEKLETVAAQTEQSENTVEVAETADVATEQVEVTELVDWVSPYDVNYAELTEILNGEDFADYVGDRLPEEEVKRIKTDYELYLKNK